MAGQPGAKASAYDKYVNYKRFSVAVAAFILVLLIPVPDSMQDVAVEYAVGRDHVLDHYARALFGKPFQDVEQWQALTAGILEKCMRQGALSKNMVLKRNMNQLKSMGIEANEEHFKCFRALVERMPEDELNACRKMNSAA
jgi:hypothetical protein